MRASEFDFELPSERIAQEPLPRRDDARLYVLDRAGGDSHRAIRDLPSLLPPGALLVVNDTRVIRARVKLRKPTGGRVELLLVEPLDADGTMEIWRCLGGASKPIRPGPLHFANGDQVDVLRVEGEYVDVAFRGVTTRMDEWLETAGEVPLPPYIRRDAPRALGPCAERRVGCDDRERYQTVFARHPGAVAAPTAGLHFTPELLAALETAGIGRAAITLHVGPGTFAPLRSDDVDGVELHAERFSVPESTARAIAEARAHGRAVIAVGTTVVRTLETAAAEDGTVRAGAGQTRLFIKPGHRFRAVDGMLTNFHLPRSTLLMLVCAFGGPKGKDRVLAAYREAVRAGYRFYSYGDAMLIP